MNGRRVTSALGVMVLAALGVAATITPAYAASLTSQINGLVVQTEVRTGYDRGLFGDYDRKALLAANYAAWPNCDGYYSEADGKCYTNPKAVDVDHMVALAEAWDSGARDWNSDKLDAFAGDTQNLWLMTVQLNRGEKSDDDFAEWTPPRASVLCSYLTRYVAVKVKYHLSVDTTEKASLLSAAKTCTSSKPKPKPTPVVTPTDGLGGTLPNTGSSDLGYFFGGGLFLFSVGSILLLIARKRNARFVAE